MQNLQIIYQAIDVGIRINIKYLMNNINLDTIFVENISSLDLKMSAIVISFR